MKRLICICILAGAGVVSAAPLPQDPPIDHSWLGICYMRLPDKAIICHPPLAPAPQLCFADIETGAVTCGNPVVPNAPLPPTNITTTVN